MTARVPHSWNVWRPLGTHESHPLQGSSCFSVLCWPHTPPVPGPARFLALRQPVTAGWPPRAAFPAVSFLPRRPRSPSPAGPIPLHVQGLWTAGRGFLETVVCPQAPGGSRFPYSFTAPFLGRWSVLPVALGLGARVDPAPVPCRMWRVLLPSGLGGVASASGVICAVSLTSSPAHLLQSLSVKLPPARCQAPRVSGYILSLLFSACLACLWEASSAV